jgi:pimeloyl-ACP methyl ester carboxylesterase
VTTAAADRTVRVAGGELKIRRRGRGGPALVFLHYWGGSARTWDAVIGELGPGHDTVCFDQRGWSSSRQLPGPYGLSQLADDLIALLAGLRLDEFVLVGHSMGGKVSQLAAARHPAGMTGLVLVAPAPPLPPAHVTAGYQQMLAHAYDTAETAGQAIKQALTAVSLTEAATQAIVRDSLSADPSARQEWPLRGISADITATIGTIGYPALVVAGERDKVEPPHVLEHNLLPYLSDAEFVVIPRSGHLLPLEAPAALATTIREWLSATQKAHRDAI